MAAEFDYALKDGKWVHVSEVERGLKCDCRCPVCGGRLVANKGSKNAHHFKHYKEDADGCSMSNETALHLRAKQMVFDIGEVCLPSMEENLYMMPNKISINTNSNGYAVLEDYEIGKEVGWRPDVCFYIDGEPFAIEIAVTSPVTSEKQEKIKSVGIPCVEIDLSGVDRSIDDIGLFRIITTNFNNLVKWVYNPIDCIMDSLNVFERGLFKMGKALDYRKEDLELRKRQRMETMDHIGFAVKKFKPSPRGYLYKDIKEVFCPKKIKEYQPGYEHSLIYRALSSGQWNGIVYGRDVYINDEKVFIGDDPRLMWEFKKMGAFLFATRNDCLKCEKCAEIIEFNNGDAVSVCGFDLDGFKSGDEDESKKIIY